MTPGSPAAAGTRWAVVGGGVMGLHVAARLAEAGQAVTVFESAPELGGLASAWQLGPITWDRHYHVTLLSDQWTRGMLRELDLEKEMEWVETKTGFFTNDRLHSLSSSLDYLRLPGLGWIGKARLAATILWASRMDDGTSLRKVPVEQWLRRWSGDATFERLWRPLLRSKLGDEYRRTAATFIWTTIRRLYAARRTGLKKEMFGYVPGGYARVFERFAERLTAAGAQIRVGTAVRRVERVNGRLEIETDTDTGSFDQVVVTTPPAVATRFCRGLQETETQRMEAVSYQGLVCASLLLRRPLSKYYLTYLTDDDFPFTGVIEMSAFVDPRHFGGRSLVYLPKYTVPSDPLFEAEDVDIERSFLQGLRRVHPDLRREDVECFRVSRVRSVFPIPTFEGTTDPPPMRVSVPGLFFVNSAQVEDGTLNVNDTLRRAESAAAELMDAPRPQEATS